MANIKDLIQSIESGDSSFDEKLAAINAMEETLVAMRAQEQSAIDDNVAMIVEAIAVMQRKVEAQLEVAKAIVPEIGPRGPKGEPGERGLDGANGRDGRDGRDGVDGRDGTDGVSVTDANIDFDGSLIITLSSGRVINVGEVVAPDLAEKIKLVTSGGGTSQSVLDAIAALQATIATYGTMALQNANAVAITGGNINNTVIGNTTPNAATFTTLTATGQTDLGTGSAQFIRAVGGASAPTLSAQGSGTNVALNFSSKAVADINFFANNSDIGFKISPNGTTGNSWTAYGSSVSPILEASGVSTNVNGIIRTKGSGVIALRTNTVDEQARISHTASAVNYVQVTGAATGNTPAISSQGSDANINLLVNPKGTGAFVVFGNSGTQFRVSSVASAVNNLNATGAIAGAAPSLASQGTDTNISQVFQSKGTGAIDLAAGSSGVNISNGGTVTAITRTANGSGYTSFPSLAISAPTTAGGVQATATPTMFNSTATVAGGGTGYTVGDVLTMVGGTTTGGAGTYTVSTVSAGVITGITTTASAVYTTLPTNPVSITGGTGTGATLTVTYGVNTAFTITNAGSGYVEQPTVTFSGGGGSGAAAYATVGSIPILKSIGSALSFFTPNGEQFRVDNFSGGATTTDYVLATGSSFGRPVIRSAGATNVSLGISSSGTGSVQIFTNVTAQEQLRIAHTASAVNYVQVTGAATGGAPAVTAQGSDSAVALSFFSKGGSAVNFWTGGTNTTRALAIFGNSGNVVNGFTISPALAGGAPTFAVAGSDTNIDLALTPKGTGNVRFGTYTANMALTVQGYIEIKDSGGTVRRLAVVA